ncbi:hypothetical protein H0H87_007362, partial [Tephrocybe sp. NHM501043]
MSSTTIITNETMGKTVLKALTSPTALCQQNTEWIMEDFKSNGSLILLADFGT